MAKAKDKTIFHERLKLLLEESGHNQVWLARTLGFSTPSVNGWTQDSEPSYTTLCKIAKLFGVTTDYLLGLTESKSTDFSIRACSDITGLTENAIWKLLSLRPVIGEINTGQLESVSAFLSKNELVICVDRFLRSKPDPKERNSVFGENIESDLAMLTIERLLLQLKNDLNDTLHDTPSQENIHQYIKNNFASYSPNNNNKEKQNG